MKFRTETGSIYEVDFEGRRVRRLLGNHAPTARQGEDGTWREYYAISHGLEWIGSEVLIEWDDEGHATITTVVEQVWHDATE